MTVGCLLVLLFVGVKTDTDGRNGLCSRGEGPALFCRNCGAEDLVQALSSDLHSVFVRGYQESTFDLGVVCFLPNVTSVSVVWSGVSTVLASVGGGYLGQSVNNGTLIAVACENSSALTSLNLSFNAIELLPDFNLLPYFERLEEVILAHNRLTTFPTIPVSSVRSLDVSHNSIETLPEDGFSRLKRLRYLDASHNRLKALGMSVAANFSFDGADRLRVLLLQHNDIASIDDETLRGLRSVQVLNLSHNRLQTMTSEMVELLPDLKLLDLSHNPIVALPALRHRHLEQLVASHLLLSYLSFESFAEADRLTTVDLSHNKRLRWIFGSVARNTKRLLRLDLSHCALATLPVDFFRGCSLAALNVADNPWKCGCNLVWFTSLPATTSLLDGDSVHCRNGRHGGNESTPVDASSVPPVLNCTLGINHGDDLFHRAAYGSSLYVGCDGYSYPAATILWERLDTGSTARKLFEWLPDRRSVVSYDGDSGGAHLLPGGVMSFPRLSRESVGVYRCIMIDRYGVNVSQPHFVRLNYDVWYEVKVYSVVVGIFTSVCCFLLNIVFLVVRRIVSWHLTKLERTGRVRNVLEAMERYRQRQMDSLYEKYSNGIQQICENYRQQLEQLRKSYAQQSERFRDYRTAQMDAVTQHIDLFREGYAQQAGRVYQYGSRQMERLWVSYQRQVNRLRTLTVSYRFRVMRQHKIKQKYWNKILASFTLDVCKVPSPKLIFIDPKTSQLPRISPEELASTKPVIKIPKISITSAEEEDFDEDLDIDAMPSASTSGAVAAEEELAANNRNRCNGGSGHTTRLRHEDELVCETTGLLKSRASTIINVMTPPQSHAVFEGDVQHRRNISDDAELHPGDGVPRLKLNEGYTLL